MQPTESLRDLIIHALQHLDHVLPGQAPLKEFVHHNTLHGFQHLPFEEALQQFEALTGIQGYLPEARYREFYRQGRINDHDINEALAKMPEQEADAIICTVNTTAVTYKTLIKLAMLYDFSALTTTQLQWEIKECQALSQVQNDVPEAVKQQLLAGDTENTVIKALWESILQKLTSTTPMEALHPETLLTITPAEIQDWRNQIAPELTCLPNLNATPKHRNNAIRWAAKDLLAQVGTTLSLRDVILKLTATDILEQVRPYLIRLSASAMDEGVAAWTLPERQQLGLYKAWRTTAVYDIHLFLPELSDGQNLLASLPVDAIDTIILHLTELTIPQKRWAGYLQRLALELPGWSGLINWRQQRPNYRATPVALADYLAIRLTLDRLWLTQICLETWKIKPSLTALKTYFRHNLDEFFVRCELYTGELPEYLIQRAEESIALAQSDWRQVAPDWAQIADLIGLWNRTRIGDYTIGHNRNWKMFRLCQHLGLRAEAVQQMPKDDFNALYNGLEGCCAMSKDSAKIWLVAYENHYRDALFQGLKQNHNRGRWAKRDTRPAAQLIFCMDDREEGFRRHLEEHNPALETLGAAGFFGVPMNYQGLDDTETFPLCPIVVTPVNAVQEQPRAGQGPVAARHQRGRKWLFSAANTLHQSLRRNLVLSQPLIHIGAPITLIGLLAKTLFPKTQTHLLAGLAQQVSPAVATELRFNAPDPKTDATLDNPKQGFTDNEQANRVAAFCRNTGLTYGFAPLVVLLGHGSMSQNNPHLAAYDCGACSGRHGGPNARVFAAMANRPIVHQLLAERGITIPTDTWFIGAEHNTCDEAISWYDLQDLPASHQPALQKLQAELQHAQLLSAHERCRRLASAPRNPTPKQALKHIAARATDFSQARPELGHATNAAAVIGRRSITQGAFFDRRVFLISYDPTQDPDGTIVEGILLAAGPVGAGINLEYYFSTVNNERFGCGSKVPHNVTGFFAVMEGASSDLRTGLPQQMVEIHEAMRLQIVVEAKTTVLERIYAEQDSLRELIAGGWVHLSAKDPDTGNISVFERGVGFVPWQAADEKLPVHASSPACYAGQSLPIDPALIVQPENSCL